MGKPVIAPGCIQCEACMQFCPDVFRMGGDGSEVIYQEDYDKYKIEVDQAIAACPKKISIVMKSGRN